MPAPRSPPTVRLDNRPECGMQRGEHERKPRERTLQRRGHRGGDPMQDVLLQPQDRALIRAQHLAHPRGKRVAVQAPAPTADGPPGTSLDPVIQREARVRVAHGSVRARPVLSLHELLQAPERVPHGNQTVQALALGGVQKREVRADAEARGAAAGRVGGRQDDHLAWEPQQGQEHLGDHLRG